MVYALELHDSGVVRLNKVGFRAFCSIVHKDRLLDLRSFVDANSLEDIEWFPHAGHDWRMAQIQAGGAEVRIVLEEPPEDLIPLLRALDALFRDYFGRRYDMPLLSE